MSYSLPSDSISRDKAEPYKVPQSSIPQMNLITSPVGTHPDASTTASTYTNTKMETGANSTTSINSTTNTNTNAFTITSNGNTSFLPHHNNTSYPNSPNSNTSTDFSEAADSCHVTIPGITSAQRTVNRTEDLSAREIDHGLLNVLENDLDHAHQTVPNHNTGDDSEKLETIASAVKTILTCLGEDPSRQGLALTPLRYANALLSLTRGYHQSLTDLHNNAFFDHDSQDIVILKAIPFHSLCEHHLIPFFGKIHIGYLPQSRVLGLSKIVRVSEMFTHRLQIQERLTRQIAQSLDKLLSPKGVAVVIEATHLCLSMRGVEKSSAITTTTCFLGSFRSKSEHRHEFLRLIHH